MWLLLALFCFRVFAQLLQWVFPSELLPPFAAWHSAALPYGVLLSSQVLIIILMVFVCTRFTRGRVTRNRLLGGVLLVTGTIYLVTMLGRLLVGLFVLPDHHWFGQFLPAVFHLVLALFVLLVGSFHSSRTGRTMR